MLLICRAFKSTEFLVVIYLSLVMTCLLLSSISFVKGVDVCMNCYKDLNAVHVFHKFRVLKLYLDLSVLGCILIPANWMQGHLVYMLLLFIFIPFKFFFLHVDRGHKSGMQLITVFVFVKWKSNYISQILLIHVHPNVVPLCSPHPVHVWWMGGEGLFIIMNTINNLCAGIFLNIEDCEGES